MTARVATMDQVFAGGVLFVPPPAVVQTLMNLTPDLLLNRTTKTRLGVHEVYLRCLLTLLLMTLMLPQQCEL
jgi:hypothetical protein